MIEVPIIILAPNGRCGRLSDRGDFCNGETREHKQMKNSDQLPLLLKNPADNDCADRCLILSYQVSAQSDKNCKLSIGLNISRCAPPGRKLKNPASSDFADWLIILLRFRSIGPRRSDEKQFEILEVDVPWAGIEKSGPSDYGDWCVVPSQQVSKQSVENCKTRSKKCKMFTEGLTDGLTDSRTGRPILSGHLFELA